MAFYHMKNQADRTVHAVYVTFDKQLVNRMLSLQTVCLITWLRRRRERMHADSYLFLNAMGP